MGDGGTKQCISGLPVLQEQAQKLCANALNESNFLQAFKRDFNFQNWTIFGWVRQIQPLLHNLLSLPEFIKLCRNKRNITQPILLTMKCTFLMSVWALAPHCEYVWFLGNLNCFSALWLALLIILSANQSRVLSLLLCKQHQFKNLNFIDRNGQSFCWMLKL